MNRKLKRAIAIADHWMALEIDCRFATRRRAGFDILRETEDYTVTLMDPKLGDGQPRMEIVAAQTFLEGLSGEDKDVIAHNETLLFKTYMALGVIEEEKIRLDKKSREQFHAHMMGK